MVVNIVQYFWYVKQETKCNVYSFMLTAGAYKISLIYLCELIKTIQALTERNFFHFNSNV